MKRITVTIGFMEAPRVPSFLALARRKGLDFDIMQTSFFLGRRPSGHPPARACRSGRMASLSA